MKAYSIILVGQGHTHITIVDQETFDWVYSDSQAGRVGNESSWDDKACPPNVLKRLDNEYPYVTSGSMNNDRALVAPALKIQDEELECFDMMDFMNIVQKHNIQIIDSFEGYIY